MFVGCLPKQLPHSHMSQMWPAVRKNNPIESVYFVYFLPRIYHRCIPLTSLFFHICTVHYNTYCHSEDRIFHEEATDVQSEFLIDKMLPEFISLCSIIVNCTPKVWQSCILLEHSIGCYHSAVFKRQTLQISISGFTIILDQSTCVCEMTDKGVISRSICPKSDQ